MRVVTTASPSPATSAAAPTDSQGRDHIAWATAKVSATAATPASAGAIRQPSGSSPSATMPPAMSSVPSGGCAGRSTGSSRSTRSWAWTT